MSRTFTTIPEPTVRWLQPEATKNTETKRADKKDWQKKVKAWFINYSQFFQVLIVAGFFYLLLYFLMIYVRPTVVADWLLPDLYLPVAVILLVANFFFFTFVWQNKTNGLWTTLWVQTFVFLRFQRVKVSWWLAILLSLPWVILIILNLRKKNQPPPKKVFTAPQPEEKEL